jgi:SpoVK/Ycf46/Vps4 family AAA+-type ATPase
MIAVERETWKATAAEWKEAARLNMEADDCWQPRAVAAEARALASERREQAAETARRPIIDVLLDIGDRLTDEGDRIYLGSTNDADLLRSVARRLEDASAVYARQKPTDPIT